MAFRVEISKQGFGDLDAIASHIKESGSFEAAKNWFNGILKAIHTLRELPERCAVCEESREVGREVRMLLHGSRNRTYKIYYAVQHESRIVQILHVRHWARGPVSPEYLKGFPTETGPEGN